MTTSASETRTVAMRVAKALREKGRAPEAVLVLCAWAAGGPNDVEGQALLAEALRIDPKSALAKMAFERMEGVAVGDHGEFDQTIAHYSPEEVARLDKEVGVARPAFRKAQVGFNNNIKYKGKHYHVQTEDSGLDKPHIITHLFADGGRILKSHKRGYGAEVHRDDVAGFVRALMKGQHMEMVLALREGTFNAVIDGAKAGGMEVLEHAPVVEVNRLGSGAGAKVHTSGAPAAGSAARADGVSAGAHAGPSAMTSTVAPKRDAGPVRFFLHVQRSLSGGPERYEPNGDVVVIGKEGSVPLEGERFCHPCEAALSWESGRLWLEDFEGGNGVFLRIKKRVELGIGDEFIVGDQLLRLERNPEADDSPAEGPTYYLSSMKGPSAFRVVQIFEGGAVGACAMAREAMLQIGSALEYANDLVLPRDPLVSRYHCIIEEQAETFVLTDLGAKSGVFVRVNGRQPIADGDELLIGRTRLLVDLSPSRAELAS